MSELDLMHLLLASLGRVEGYFDSLGEKGNIILLFRKFVEENDSFIFYVILLMFITTFLSYCRSNEF
jgi:hypothetical protein